jgi:hypothetical protein
MKTYSVWTSPKQERVQTITFVEGKERPRSLNGAFMPDTEVLLFTIDAATWEEAQAIKHLRMGWEPYKPQGGPKPCPRCEAVYYPEGKGECWQCGYT